MDQGPTRDLNFRMGEKKRKLQNEEALKSSVGDSIEPQSVVPTIDTSNWPLLLKVCQHSGAISNQGLVEL